ncbi:hypothetical protein Bhyg_07060 [Pseudolycoriella hygida]|uniref:Uncharacterized protein n=1 Tax=Pseudolycoriella hygida TaxID=35572 RepID=A0A9Q0N3V6_9DIPT|nr:hypothetical protein Bhyg_07060 [Pseudolycoriella hygida]
MLIIPKNVRLIILFLLIAICRTTARTRSKLAKKDMTEKQVIITAIGQCAGDEGLPVNVVPMDIIRQGRFDYYIDGVVLIREDFDDGFKVKLDVLRCNQREIVETCTSVLNYVNSSELCELLKKPVDAYTKALDQIEPRPICPMKKGSYILHHLPTDDSLLKFIDWRKQQGTESFVEEVFLAYFEDKSQHYAPSTLWSIYSMLKSKMIANHNIDISRYSRLLTFVKTKNVGFQSKQASVFTPEEIKKFLLEAPNSEFLVIKAVTVFGISGGCRGEEICNVMLGHVKDTGSEIVV